MNINTMFKATKNSGLYPASIVYAVRVTVKTWAKYVGCGLMMVTMIVEFIGLNVVGARTDQTSEMMVANRHPSQEIHEQVAATFAASTSLGKRASNILTVLTQMEAGFHLGNLVLCNEPVQRGYRAGRIFFEAAAIILPFTKAGQVLQLTKTEFLTQMMQKKVLSKGGRKIAGEMIGKLATTTMCFLPGTKIKTRDGLRNIEDIRADMMVWSRDEFTGESGWKRVAQTFVTHPTRIHHLTYALRAPPTWSAAGSTDTPVRLVSTETLGVTAPHPFWVSSRPQPGFVPAEDLHAGDVLSLADGGTAVVTANVIEQAPASGTFTTYNFEVEEFHTYFAGETGVWVHNQGQECERIFSVFNNFIEKSKGNLWAAYESLLQRMPNLKGQLEMRAKAFAEILDRHLKKSSGTYNLAAIRSKLFPNGKPLGTAGTSASIREITGDALEGGKLLRDISAGCKITQKVGYKGVALESPDGGFLGVRYQMSKSPQTAVTIDVDIPGLLEIRKIKFNP